MPFCALFAKTLFVLKRRLSSVYAEHPFSRQIVFFDKSRDFVHFPEFFRVVSVRADNEVYAAFHKSGNRPFECVQMLFVEFDIYALLFASSHTLSTSTSAR